MKLPLIVSKYWGRITLLYVFFSFLAFDCGVIAQNSSDAYSQINQTLGHIQYHQDSLEDYLTRLTYQLNLKNENRKLYLNPNWQNSFLVSMTGKVYYFSGRLNALTNIVEIKMKDKIRAIYPERIKAVVIGDRTFLPLRGSEVENLNKPIAYFEVLSSGRFHLLSRFGILSRIEGGDSLSPELTGERVYKVDEVLYYTQNFGRVSRLRSSKKKLLELFGEKSPEVENFVKNKKLRFAGKENLTLIFDYYNRLTEK